MLKHLVPRCARRLSSAVPPTTAAASGFSGKLDLGRLRLLDGEADGHRPQPPLLVELAPAGRMPPGQAGEAHRLLGGLQRIRQAVGDQNRRDRPVTPA